MNLQYNIRKWDSATESVKTMYTEDTDAMKVRKYMLLIKMFLNENCDQSDKYRHRRSPNLNDGFLKENIELDPDQSTRNLFQIINSSCSSVPEYFNHITN